MKYLCKWLNSYHSISEVSINKKLDQHDIFLPQSFLTLLTRLGIDCINLLRELGFKFNHDSDKIEAILS